MNVALSILLVVTFLLPGLIFRRFYYSEEFSKESFKESFFQVLYTAFFPSIFLYFFTIWWVGFLNYSIDFNLIGTLVAPDESNKTVFNNINQMQSEIVWFHIGLYFEAAFFGFLFRTIVRKRGWDKSVKLFRYQNHWHYLFTGEYMILEDRPHI